MSDKQRATTIQQRFGFKDDELKTVTHDQIVIWLYENVESILSSYALGWLLEDVEKVQRDLGLTSIDGNRKEAHLSVISKKLEAEISDRNFIIGFVDMIAEVKIVRCFPFQETRYSPYGTISTVSRAEFSESIEEILFEVKTSIPSLGELLRQINMYRKYKRGKFFVVCPDNRFETMLREQGVYFIKYDKK